MISDFKAFDLLNDKLRHFFRTIKGFTEIPTQANLSILAACEDPETISQFVFNGVNWPLPQTGQMFLEKILLENPDLPGCFCFTTSYRNEAFPIPGRHDKIFPLFEFESRGTVDDMKAMEAELLEFLGFDAPESVLYEDLCTKYDAHLLDADHETKIWEDIGPCISIEKFPLRTDPFWNMRRSETASEDPLYHKVDVVLYGQETIGSAERSCNRDEMKADFLTISEGKYAKLLFAAFGEARVMAEMDTYLAHEMFPRFGGGIGLTRLIRAWKLHQEATA
jgi:aspartyl/asparaginyl-tRNA synthetase